MMALVRFVYNLIFPVVLVLMLPSFVLRMIRRGNYRHKFWQRFGIYSPRVLEKIGGGGRTWMRSARCPRRMRPPGSWGTAIRTSAAR